MRLQVPLYTSNRHRERGDWLITALLCVYMEPGRSTTDIAWVVAPEQAARFKERVGWWFGCYLKKWHTAGFLKRGYYGKRATLRYFLTNKGLEVLLSLGVEPALRQVAAEYAVLLALAQRDATET